MDKIFSICSTLRTDLVASFADALEVSSDADGCIVTLPLKTADRRNIDVFIERMTGSDAFVYVHDGGKSTAELYAQGIHPTDSQTKMLKGIAIAHNAVLQGGRFQILCKSEAEVQAAVLAISQCATLAMVDVVTHAANVEEEPLMNRVGRALNAWCPPGVEIERRHIVKGRTGVEHMFEFASLPQTPDAGQPVAIKLLPPSVGPSWQVSRYGFMVLDLHGRKIVKWPRLAIVSKSEEWSAKSLDVVRALSTEVILLESDREEEIERSLPRKMTELTEAA